LGKDSFSLYQLIFNHGKKKRFCCGNKIKDNKFFVAATKNFAAATKGLVDRTKQFVVTKYFWYLYFNK